MKKLFFISLLFATAQFPLYSQSKGLSEEGYKHWYKATALMADIKQESDYFLILDEFSKVVKTDSTYADAYSNMGILWVKIGDLGGGIPCYDSAKICYDKYFSLQPSEKSTILKELAYLEVKKEKFIGNIGLDNMVLINNGRIEPFYIQNNMFTLAEYKRLITPIAILVTARLHGTTLKPLMQQSPTGNNNTPIITNFYNAEEIVKVINCVTGRNYFIITDIHLKSMKKNKTLRFGGEYLAANASSYRVFEWVDYSDKTKYHKKHRLCRGYAKSGVPKPGLVVLFAFSEGPLLFFIPLVVPKKSKPEMATKGNKVFAFRLVLPASEK